jgi:mannose-6-phosphate isomerase-like protein (cupin superfamily)
MKIMERETMDKKVFAPFELTGPGREQALRECREQLQAWGLAMPGEPPVVRHFGLGRFREIGEIEFWIANRREDGYCSKFLFLFDGQTCPSHCHESKHETFFVMKGRIRMVAGGEQRLMEQGDSLAMPTGCVHSFTGLGPALVLEVSKPSLRGDSYFEDPRIRVL